MMHGVTGEIGRWEGVSFLFWTCRAFLCHVLCQVIRAPFACLRIEMYETVDGRLLFTTAVEARKGISPRVGAGVAGLLCGDAGIWAQNDTRRVTHCALAIYGFAGARCPPASSSGSRCGPAWLEAAIPAFHPVGATRRRGQVRVPLRIWCRFDAASLACPDDKAHRAVFSPGLPAN